MKLSPSLIEKGKNILIALMTIFIINSFFLYLFGHLSGSDRYKLIATETAPWQALFGACIMAPLIEELIFRYGTFQVLRTSSKFEQLKLPVMIISSVIFGWLHGSFFNVYIQGTAGFIMAWVYLKNNHSYWSSVIVHACWNFALLYWLPSMVQQPSLFSF